MFSGLRQGGMFYILENDSEIRLKIGQVLSVSNPQQKYGQFGQQSYGAQPEMVVDVKVKVGDDVLEFKQLNANMNIANSGKVVVSDSKEAMNAEVEGLLRNSKQVIESVPYHEKVIAACDSMLRELNPQFAKEKEQEEKIGILEERMGNIDDKLNKMFDLLSDTLERKPKKIKEE
jgi:ribosome-associated translation inhibitor RaiA